MAKVEEIVSQIKELSIMDVAELVKALEDEFGVSAAAPMAVAAPVAGAGAEAAAEEKDSYTVVLTGAGDNKINVIKVIRELKPELGLKEAKDLVDKTPSNIAEGVKTEEAKKMEEKLKAAGAAVELK
ncbi:50S ribosomal protein L7/L12 [candidate division WWE3 bacterium]|nr:50S ribosomal protein L7/L12 [candidate division WWE3 bacterium]